MDKITIEQFGQKIKAKYPQYADMSDAELGSKMLAKYPEYNDIVQTAPAQPEKTFIEKVGQFVGVENLGKSIAQFIFKQTPTGKALEEKMKNGTANEYEKEAYESIKKDNPTLKQVIGDVVQVAATVGTAGIGGAAAKSAMGVGKVAAKMGAVGAVSGAGAAMSANQDTNQIIQSAFTTGLASAATAGVFEAIGQLSKAALDKLPSRIYASAAKLDKETANVLMNEKQAGTLGRLKAITDNQIDEINDTITKKISLENPKWRFNSKDFLKTIKTEIKKKWQGASDKEINQAIRRWKIDPFLTKKEVDLLTADSIRRGIGTELKTAWKMEGSPKFNQDVGMTLWKNIANAIRNPNVTDTMGDFKRFSAYVNASTRIGKVLKAQEKNFGLKLSDLILGSAVGLGSGGVGGVAAVAVKKAEESAATRTGLAIGMNELNKMIDKIPAKYFDAGGKITRTALLRALSEANE